MSDEDESLIDPDCIRTDYCLHCSCGVFLQQGPVREGYISIFTCPLKPEMGNVYYNPVTGERVEHHYVNAQPDTPSSCQIHMVCTVEHVKIPLRDLLREIPGWTMHVQEERDYSDYLDVDMDIPFTRIADPIAYRQWQHQRDEAQKKHERAERKQRLQQELAHMESEGEQ